MEPVSGRGFGGFGSARAYRFYHASLREFFGGAIDTACLTWPEQTFVAELAEATGQAHARIADVFVRRWGGWDACLPALQTIAPARLDNLDRYGLRHLTAHLEAAGREDDLHHLMRLEWSSHQGNQTRARFENVWYTVHERVGDTSGYLGDVDRAWRLTEEAFAVRRSPIAIGRQCRYALILTSLCSLAGNIPPALLAALVEKGIWPGPQGLAYARQIQESGLRTRALAALAPHLGPTERDRALREALEAARAIASEGPRSEALAALAPRLAELGHPAERWRRRGPSQARGPGPGRWPRWPPTWGRPSGTEPSARRWRRRGPSQARGPGPRRWPRWPPTCADRAGPSPPRGAGGGAGHRRRGAPVQGAGRAGPPPDRARAPRGAGGGADHRSRVVPVRGAGGAGSAPGGARPPGRGAEGGAGHRRRGAPVRGAGRAGPPPDRARAPRGLEAVRAIEFEVYRFKALAALAPRLAELATPAEALEAARAIASEWFRSEALPALARAWRS